MTTTHSCKSCGMSISSGLLCQYCVTPDGSLQPFDERFERMVQWSMSREPSLARDEAERKTRAYMRTMPAWKDHPQLADQPA
ncbi:hypothetical protein [Piscinibacter terrae]|uniref:Zinc ribbon domain-containing protein n=1 Tax=Piscinibacter terrae TaxID=2496871 RepID=A0A3N7JQ86_9BURK|nr:hypothetical protein [Albitalea terrae]RQP21215.1 hypothetical protein DZC73_28650 [Albitalea terrae]